MREEFEYKVVTLKKYMDPITYEKKLNKLAKEGWKLISVKNKHKFFLESEELGRQEAVGDLLIFEKREEYDV